MHAGAHQNSLVLSICCCHSWTTLPAVPPECCCDLPCLVFAANQLMSFDHMRHRQKQMQMHSLFCWTSVLSNFCLISEALPRRLVI